MLRASAFHLDQGLADYIAYGPSLACCLFLEIKFYWMEHIHAHLFTCLLPVDAFMLQQLSWIVVKEIVWSTNLKHVWLFTKKKLTPSLDILMIATLFVLWLVSRCIFTIDHVKNSNLDIVSGFYNFLNFLL